VIEGRTLPYNLVAEESLLGAMLLSFDAVLTAYEIVIAADFYKPAHGHIFQAIIDLYLDNQPGDPVTVADALRRQGLLETVGGPRFLVNLQAGTPATSNAGRYATIVVEHAGMRRLMQIGNSIVEAGYDLRDPGEILEEAKVALSMVDTGEGARMEGLTTMEEFRSARRGSRPVGDPRARPGALAHRGRRRRGRRKGRRSRHVDPHPERLDHHG
jgi:replicative DNA helicase